MRASKENGSHLRHLPRPPTHSSTQPMTPSSLMPSRSSCLPQGCHIALAILWDTSPGLVSRVLLGVNIQSTEQHIGPGALTNQDAAYKQPEQQFRGFPVNITSCLLLYPDSVFSFSSCRKRPSLLEHHRIATKYPCLPCQYSPPRLYSSTKVDR